MVKQHVSMKWMVAEWKQGNQIFKEPMINDKTDEAIKKRFQSILYKYQIGLEASIKGSDFIFDCVGMMH